MFFCHGIYICPHIVCDFLPWSLFSKSFISMQHLQMKQKTEKWEAMWAVDIVYLLHNFNLEKKQFKWLDYFLLCTFGEGQALTHCLAHSRYSVNICRKKGWGEPGSCPGTYHSSPHLTDLRYDCPPQWHIRNKP